MRRANRDDLKRLAGGRKQISVAAPAVGHTQITYWIDVITGEAHPYDAVVVSKRLRREEGVVVVSKRLRRGKGFVVRYVTGEIEEIPAHEGRMHSVVALLRRRVHVASAGRATARPKVRTCRCGARFTGRRSAQALGGHRSKCNRDTVVIA